MTTINNKEFVQQALNFIIEGKNDEAKKLLEEYNGKETIVSDESFEIVEKVEDKSQLPEDINDLWKEAIQMIYDKESNSHKEKFEKEISEFKVKIEKKNKEHRETFMKESNELNLILDKEKIELYEKFEKENKESQEKYNNFENFEKCLYDDKDATYNLLIDIEKNNSEVFKKLYEKYKFDDILYYLAMNMKYELF
jgi:hypothetical protein